MGGECRMSWNPARPNLNFDQLLIGFEIAFKLQMPRIHGISYQYMYILISICANYFKSCYLYCWIGCATHTSPVERLRVAPETTQYMFGRIRIRLAAFDWPRSAGWARLAAFGCPHSARSRCAGRDWLATFGQSVVWIVVEVGFGNSPNGSPGG